MLHRNFLKQGRHILETYKRYKSLVKKKKKTWCLLTLNRIKTYELSTTLAACQVFELGDIGQLGWAAWELNGVEVIGSLGFFLRFKRYPLVN